MGKKQTTVAACGVLVVWIGVTVVGRASDDPDPRTIASRMGTQPPTVGEPVMPGPQLVVAPIVASFVPAAPQVEVAARVVQPEPRKSAIVVGHGATHAFDAALQHAFGNVGQIGVGKPVLTSDRDAVELMQLGNADFAVIGGNLSPRDQRAGLRATRLGIELFALAVAPDSPLRCLTSHQVRQIFTGQVQRWSQLGLDGGPIVAVVPSERSLAERAAKALIPGDPFTSTCLGVASERHVADQLLREPGAIGIVSVTGQPRVDGLRLLQIDWVAPSADAFAYGTYPFGLPITLVTSGPPSGIAAEFLAFASSDEGRGLLARTMLPAP